MSETVNPYDDEVVDPYAGDDVKNPHEESGVSPATEPEPAEEAAPKPAAKTRKATKKK